MFGSNLRFQINYAGWYMCFKDNQFCDGKLLASRQMGDYVLAIMS